MTLSAPVAERSGRHAWVDESIHTPDEHSSGLYVMAAAIGDADGMEITREVLRSLVPKRQVRLHWRDEERGGARRRKILDAIAASDVANVVVVGTPLDPRNQERARRKCLERLLWDLCENWDVAMVWLESRTKSLNSKDMKLVDALRGQGALGPNTRIEFGLPSKEPMLWIPDAVAGCVADAQKGDAAELAVVVDMVEQIYISV